MGYELGIDLFMGAISFEIKIEEFQTQFRFTSNAYLIKNMLKVGFDRADGDTHLKGYLLIFVSGTGQVGYILLARRKMQPAVI